MTAVTLYNKKECPFCWKVRLALAETNIAADFIDFEDPEHRAHWQALTPRKTVPVLVYKDDVIYESNVILEYINDVTGALLPAAAADRLAPRHLNIYSDAVIGVGLREVIFEKRGKPEQEWDLERIRGGVEEFEKALAYLSGELGTKDYFGVQYSLPECALTARFGLAEGYGVSIPDRFANLQDWFQRMKARPSYRITAPQISLDAAPQI